MKFVDQVSIFVQSGSGGSGVVSFRRERFVAKGGPDGGNGGSGGCVYLKCSSSVNTLADFRGNYRFIARDGQNGQGKKRHGANAPKLYLTVPVGTQVYDKNTNQLIGDLVQSDDLLLLVSGGKGGFGNAHFKTSTNQAPIKRTVGRAGINLDVHLELKVLADVGLVGLPNAGKSSLTQAISNSNTKIDNYPFTTLHPHLGVVDVDIDRNFLIADIPGLIEGASRGVGLGFQFLRHLSRVRLVVYILDAANGFESVQKDLDVLQYEISSYNDEIVQRPSCFVMNKMDLLSPEQQKELSQRCKQHFSHDIFYISAKEKTGLKDLLSTLDTMLLKLRKDDKY